MSFFKNTTCKIRENCSLPDIVLLFSFILVGGFNDFVSCLVSTALLTYLFLKILKDRQLHLKINLLSISVAVMVLFYGLTCFWAIDSGMAFVGFLKFLPVLLYLIALWQNNNGQKVLNVLPYFAAILVVLSSIGSLIPPIKNLFVVSGRLSGFFQYPNTFALFLLVCELLLLEKPQLKISDYITLAVLIGGLLYTGSRTVFLLFLAASFVMILLNASKKQKLIIFGIAALALMAILLVAFLGEEGNVLSRYLKIGFSQSTFVGRLLYFADALPLLLKHPFGLGYLGYHFIQAGIQTGVYNVSYVHNDFLQVALDVGIIPALLFLTATVCFFFKKETSLKRKVTVAVLVLHSMFDFDLQFISMFMLLMLFINDNNSKQITIQKTTPFKIVFPLILVVNVYMCLALTLSQFTVYKAADTLYPFNTRNKLLLLEQQTDVTAANKIADEILAQNTHYYAPYSIKAKYAYQKGDFIGVIENKNAVFLRNRFRYNEYKEYCIMLINGILAYEQAGDTASSSVLKKELIATKDGLAKNKNRLSELGSMINEQPVTSLPADILDYIEKISAQGGGNY